MSNVVINPFRFPASGAFSPLDHGASLLFWWDSAQGVVLGTPPDVDTWTDQQGGLVGAESSGGNAKPEFVDPSLNGQPGINFDPSGTTSPRLEVGPSAAINNIWSKGTLTTLWIVAQVDNLPGTGTYLFDKGWNTANAGWAVLGLGNGVWRWRQRGTSGNIERDTATNFPAGFAYYVQLDWNGDMSVLPVLRVDGTIINFTNPAGGTGNPQDDSSVDLVIGNRAGGGNNINGRINEFYATVDTAIPTSVDEAYLQQRWGL